MSRKCISHLLVIVFRVRAGNSLKLRRMSAFYPKGMFYDPNKQYFTR